MKISNSLMNRGCCVSNPDFFIIFATMFLWFVMFFYGNFHNYGEFKT